MPLLQCAYTSHHCEDLEMADRTIDFLSGFAYVVALLAYKFWNKIIIPKSNEQ
jgi:hypothetical protein